MVDRKGIEPFPKACKAPVLPLSLTAHYPYIVTKISKTQTVLLYSKKTRGTCAQTLKEYSNRVFVLNWMTTTCEYTRISLVFRMSISFNFSLLYLLMVSYYNSNILIVKSKKRCKLRESNPSPLIT